MNVPDLKTVDLRPITNRSDACVAKVFLWRNRHDRYELPWLLMGETDFQIFDTLPFMSLNAYVRVGATDMEHDPAYALKLPLVGLTFERLYGHTSIFSAYDPQADEVDFRVPPSGYDPLKGARYCTACRKSGDRHKIVPYLPPYDQTLYLLVQGRRLEIQVGVVK